MFKWIDLVLVPYLQGRGDDIAPVLLLDDFSVHKTDEIKARFEALGVNVYWIPGGCTGLAQPVDVGIGKPLKHQIRQKWWAWLIEGGTERAIIELPPHKEASCWMAEA